MAFYAFIVDYAPDSAAARDTHRDAHMALLTELHSAGRLVISGPTDDGTGALMIVRADSKDEALSLLADEPFVANGLASRTVREWTVKFGVDRVDA